MSVYRDALPSLYNFCIHSSRRVELEYAQQRSLLAFQCNFFLCPDQLSGQLLRYVPNG
jgi:hypothetical protein